jgi:hypothetical protein
MLRIPRLAVALVVAFYVLLLLPPPAVGAAFTGRNKYVQPFTATSIWNMPIGSAATYSLTGWIQQPTQKTLTADAAVIIQDPKAPATRIQLNGGQLTNTCIGSPLLGTDPIPAGMVIPGSSGNNLYAVIHSDGNTIDEGGAFARCSAGGVAHALSLKTYGDLYGNGLTGGAGGSGLSTLGGTLRPGELSPTKSPRHVLRVNIDGAHDLWPGTPSTCFRWPAVHCDKYGPTGYGGTHSALTMGALLAIPESVPLSTLKLQSAAGAHLAWTLQNYGAYVVNDSFRSVFTICTEQGDANTVNQFQSNWGLAFATPDASGSTPWAHDLQTIISNLAVVTNNSTTSIGGGGTPLQPLAPPIGN